MKTFRKKTAAFVSLGSESPGQNSVSIQTANGKPRNLKQTSLWTQVGNLDGRRSEILNKIRLKPIKQQNLRINSTLGQHHTTGNPNLGIMLGPSKPRRQNLLVCLAYPLPGWGMGESRAPHFELITAASSHGFSGEKYSLAVISSLIIRHSLVPNKLNSFTLRQSPRNQTNHLSQQDAAFKN